MKKLTAFVPVIIIAIISIIRVNFELTNVGLVFQDRQGEICGCMIDGDAPTVQKCDNLEGLETITITVSKCN